MNKNLFNIKVSALFNDEENTYTHLICYESNPLHDHDFIEFMYVLSGTCTHFINNKTTILNSGDSYLIVPGDVHTFIKKDVSDSFLHRDILFKKEFFKKVCDFYSPDLYESIISHKYPLQIKLSNEQISYIENLALIIYHPDENNADKAIAEKILCTYIVNNMLENHFKKSTNFPKWITDIITTMSVPENLKLPLSQITKPIGYNNSYVCRQFKKYMNITLTDYFNNQKMNYASSLIKNTHFSIESISNMVGITNKAYFYSLFKKTFNTTPRKINKTTE